MLLFGPPRHAIVSALFHPAEWSVMGPSRSKVTLVYAVDVGTKQMVVRGDKGRTTMVPAMARADLAGFSPPSASGISKAWPPALAGCRSAYF
jgi:hypothetical protein